MGSGMPLRGLWPLSGGWAWALGVSHAALLSFQAHFLLSWQRADGSESWAVQSSLLDLEQLLGGAQQGNSTGTCPGVTRILGTDTL